MSLSGVNSCQSLSQWQKPAKSATTSSSSSSIDNTGSIATSGTLTAFLQSFSTDLQSLLAQQGGGSATPGADGAGSPAAANEATKMSHHHHHHHAAGGTQQAANQLVGEIGGALQGGSLSADQINQSASMLATDLMKALQAYGGARPTGGGTSTLA